MDINSCDKYINDINWRIKNDETIQYAYKGIKFPETCAYKPDYFSGQRFSKRLREPCNKDTSPCENNNNFCSLNSKNECYFDINRVDVDFPNKIDRYNKNIVNSTKDEMKRITKGDNHNDLLKDFDPENVLSGRGENHTISIVKADCNSNTGGNKNANIEDYTCEPGIIKYPEVNLAKYNNDYNTKKLRFPKIEINNKNMDKKQNMTDINNNLLYPKSYRNLLTEFQQNNIFKRSLDKLMGMEYNEKEMMKDFMDPKFTINNWTSEHIDFIENKLIKLNSLTPNEIKKVINNLNFSKELNDEICKGEHTLNLIQAFNIILEFFHIRVDLTELNDNGKKNVDMSIEKLTPYIKKVLKQIIDLSMEYESELCDENSDVTESLQKIYNTMFKEVKPEITVFKNVDIMPKFLDEFTTTFYGKLILMIFIAFIFSKLVDLFSNKANVNVPINK